MRRRDNYYDFAAQVGARIRLLRLERGLSGRKLAELAKCCASNIPLIELGRSAIQLSTLCKIAHALQVQPYDLLNHAPENDDSGYIIEKMRQDPATRAIVKKQLAAWGVIAANTR